jgi:molecular chaperone GrpE
MSDFPRRELDEQAEASAGLQAQNAELRRQNAELWRQSAELRRQVDDLQAQVEELQVQVAELQDQNAELRDRVAELDDLRRRALADADNMRKRHASELEVARGDARVAREWLPIVDNLDRALEHAEADPASIIEGVRTVRDQAAELLARLGFPRREDLGTTFDPARHEAVGVRSNIDARPGTVVDVVRPAYGDGDHQLRPALVVVAKGD